MAEPWREPCPAGERPAGVGGHGAGRPEPSLRRAGAALRGAEAHLLQREYAGAPRPELGTSGQAKASCRVQSCVDCEVGTRATWFLGLPAHGLRAASSYTRRFPRLCPLPLLGSPPESPASGGVLAQGQPSVDAQTWRTVAQAEDLAVPVHSGGSKPHPCLGVGRVGTGWQRVEAP